MGLQGKKAAVRAHLRGAANTVHTPRTDVPGVISSAQERPLRCPKFGFAAP